MALTGFLMQGTCYPTSAMALTALQSEFPMFNNNIATWSTAATFTAPNTFNITVATRALNATTTTAPTVKAIVLPLCDPAIPFDPNVSIFDPVLAGAVWMFAITMVLGVWVLAKNAGIIIDMVKRW